jgi:hypothetical protein
MSTPYIYGWTVSNSTPEPEPVVSINCPSCFREADWSVVIVDGFEDYEKVTLPCGCKHRGRVIKERVELKRRKHPKKG